MKRTNESIRQKRVAALLKEELANLFLSFFQDQKENFITITHVFVSKDLKTAEIYLSIFQHQKEHEIIRRLNVKAGFFRKAIASKVQLKYNPMLIFRLDPVFSDRERIDRIIEQLKNDGKTD
ncbi:MAG: 30S ribosome-binding factor RbfA [Acidobacteriota bacterium]